MPGAVLALRYDTLLKLPRGGPMRKFQSNLEALPTREHFLVRTNPLSLALPVLDALDASVPELTGARRGKN